MEEEEKLKERHLNDFQSNDKTRSNEWIILLDNTGKKEKMKTNMNSLVKPAYTANVRAH